MDTSDNWTILIKELASFGILLLGDGNCRIYDKSNQLQTLSTKNLIQEITKAIKKNSNLFVHLWESVSDLLSQETLPTCKVVEEKISRLFICSLKSLSDFAMCFEDLDNTTIKNNILKALDRDIKSFNKQQIIILPHYKVSLDWIHRLTQGLCYEIKLLNVSLQGKSKIASSRIVTARGVSGPWANLDLPLLERVYPYEWEELGGRTRDKRRQRRYTKGLQSYNNDGSVGEGHYWRELRNEPFLWSNRKDESPYPHRNLLN